ncbi:hypothetical protein AC578_1240 [Pseudocercospora eumusae]|uniref:Uncharacterized protein n=1 Tax=Pseudocercospora eumusae TaxID=321146 RepID=A0A139HCQ2_9PEZI|nr:hypothetical protein AC578_1240 [Pseudocercospora eumusae]
MNSTVSWIKSTSEFGVLAVQHARAYKLYYQAVRKRRDRDWSAQQCRHSLQDGQLEQGHIEPSRCPRLASKGARGLMDHFKVKDEQSPHRTPKQLEHESLAGEQVRR